MSEDWSPVASGDPLPGDPGDIAATSRRMEDIGQVCSQQRDVAAGIEPDGIWVGLAADRFAEARDRVPQVLDALARRCELGAQALHRWSGDVDAHQQAGRFARGQARQADDEIAAATAGVAARQQYLSAEALRARDPEYSPRPWPGPDWPALLADAQVRRQQAQDRFDQTVADYQADAARTADLLDDAATDDLTRGGALGLFDRIRGFLGRGGGGSTFPFLVTEDGLVLNTRESWLWETYRQAGIDPAEWDPSRGLAELDATVVAAWEFYAELFARNPDQFQWAGMATLAGGTFYAGFQDIHVLRTALQDGSMTIEEVRDVLADRLPGLPGPLLDELLGGAGASASVVASELQWVETRFLRMQRNIFDDLAWQHVAYEQGGLAALEQLRSSGEIEPLHLAAWRRIDTGDPGQVARGNEMLLDHEQRTIIGQDYDAIRDRSPITWALTMGMSVIAESPVPGGQPFRDVVPYEVRIEVTTPEVSVRTPESVGTPRSVFGREIPSFSVDVPNVGVDIPSHDVGATVAELPINNVSIFEHRWQWISEDMVPAWQHLLETGEAADLVSVPISEQADGQRMVPNWLLSYEGVP